MQQHLVDQLHPGHPLEHREDLTGLHRPPEGPPRAVHAPGQRVEVAVESFVGLPPDQIGLGPAEGMQGRDDGDALVERRPHRQPGAEQPPGVEVAGDPVQQGVARDELLEAQPPARVRHRLRHDQHPYGMGAVLIGITLDTGDAGGLRRSPPGQLLVVPRVAARSWARRVMGARALASATVSPSTPPLAASRLTTSATYGTEFRSTWTAPRATLPARPPPVR